MKKPIFLVIILAIAAVAGYWQYREYLQNPETKIIRIVNNTSLGVTKVLLLENENSIENLKITHKDLFENLEIHYAQVNSNISELEKMGATQNINREKVGILMKYLQSSQQVLTAEYDKYQKSIEYTNALKMVRLQETGVAVSGDVNSKQIEYEKAKEELAKALIKLSDACSMAGEVISKDNLVERQVIDKAIGKYQKK